MFSNSFVDQWSSILQNFVDHAYTQGMMEKGAAGELVARTIVIMARDAVFPTVIEGDVLTLEREENSHHLAHARPLS